MGSFVREGAFRERQRFLEALRNRVARLREGPLRGLDESWERTGEADVVRLTGMGVVVEILVGASAWKASVEVPPWIPFPLPLVEAKFDEEIASWKDF